MTLPVIAAHRGGSTYPENSLSSFRHACSLDVEQVEFDVHLSSDGELIVIHDHTLDQTSLAQGSVSSMTARELTDTRLRQSSDTIPSLEQALQVLAPSRLHIRLEVKEDRRDGSYSRIHSRAMDLIHRYDLAGRTTVMSFDLDVLTRFGASGLATSLSVWPSDQDSEAKFTAVITSAVNARVGDLGLSFGKTTATMLRLAHDANLTAGVWTVNDASRLDYWLRMPVAYVLTDAPQVALRIRSDIQNAGSPS
jgi:glycerophosphoryl diester phosphodiesterase